MAGLQFKIDDKVIVNGPIYQSANGTLTKGEVKNQSGIIEKAVEKAAHPYMIKGLFGWFNEKQLKKVLPIPVEINDKVRILRPYSYSGKKIVLRYKDFVVTGLVGDKATVSHNGVQTVTVNAYNLEKIK